MSPERHPLNTNFFSPIGPNDKGEVISLGTGASCLQPMVVPDNGRTLHDCHAITLARRGLVK